MVEYTDIVTMTAFVTQKFSLFVHFAVQFLIVLLHFSLSWSGIIYPYARISCILVKFKRFIKASK
jgi:hypothetical protein